MISTAAVALPATLLTVEPIRAEGDGCVGYLVADPATGTAIAIDPRLDLVDAFIDAAARHGATIAYVMDTHTHADHLSGVARMAERTGARALASSTSKIAGNVQRVSGGDRIALGSVDLHFIDAPGHTPDSLAIHAGAHLFTGDALFVGGAGRTDFPGGSTDALFDTFRRLEALPADTTIHPGHDYTGHPSSSIRRERETNELLRATRDELIARMDIGGNPPSNMQEILRLNLIGPGAPRAAGTAADPYVSPRELESLLGEAAPPLLVDVRSPIEFESEKIAGALSLPVETVDSLSAERDAQLRARPVVLVCRTGVRATIAASSLARRGISTRVLEGGVNAWRKAGLPLLEGRKRLPVDRQVQMIVGFGTLASLGLGLAVSPWFLLIAAWFGGGMAFAGATGTCGLAHLLNKAPWNKLPPPTDSLAGACAAGGQGSACAVGGAR